MKGLAQAALAVFLILIAGTARAEDKQAAPNAVPEETARVGMAEDPVQMVRTLQLMQDQIAVGSTEAHLGQRGLLGILDERFIGLDQETWKDSRNIRAAVAFVLSGGSPRVLRKLLELGLSVIPAEDRPLIEGTLAYVEGREEEAKASLNSIEPRTLPPMIGAQLALVQSALVVRNNPARSVELLDFVRLQAPGTLLEEAALRRQVFVASQIDDAKKFQFLAAAYLRRYRHSIYAGNFRQRLASALTRIDLEKNPDRFKGIVEMMDELEPDARRDLYLLVARSSLEQGRTKSALLLSEKALELSSQDPASSTRARLYHAAATIVSPELIGNAVDELQKLDRSFLPASDVALLESALAMAGQIRSVPGGVAGKNEGEQATENAATQESGPPSLSAAQASEQLQALSKAREALSRVDKLIKNEATTIQ